MTPQAVSTTDAPPVPPRVPGYDMIGCLGAGGFATVWRARARAGGEPVAIKVGRVSTALARERFAREAAALARVGAPHVPALHDHGVLDSGLPYVVMEMLRGTPLSEYLGRLPAPPGIDWLRATADAVLAAIEAVHACGLVHGDLAPDNIFLCDGPERARLVDLGAQRSEQGAAHALRAAAGRDGAHTPPSLAVVGTAEYMAPEQFDGCLDERTEVYAAGVLLYEMLTLHVPFVGTRAAIEHGHRALHPPRPDEHALVPPALAALCLACLAKEPEQRPSGIAALRDMLARACDQAAQADAVPVAVPARRSGLLGGTRGPVVLLAIDTATADARAAGPEVDAAITAVVARRKGIIARQHGRLYVCGFTGLDDDEPAQSALAAASELADRHGVRATLHVAALKVRRGRGGRPAKLYGPAVERVHAWMPTWTLAAPHTGAGPRGDGAGREAMGGPYILTTAAYARALPGGRTRPAPAHPGFYEIATTDAEDAADATRLVGRDDVVAGALASFDAMRAGGSPGLFTLYGKSGLGKSRLVRHIETLVRGRCPQARVLSLRAVRRMMGRNNDTMCRLLALLPEAARAAQAAQAAGDSGPGLEPGADAGVPDEGDTHGPAGARAAWMLGEGLRRAAMDAPLVVILDDVHRADAATLDALEYATLDGDGIHLWVVVAAHPQLRTRRPHWGMRAHRHDALDIAPLDEQAAMKLAAELLQPAEYPPAATLRRLARWAGGSPHALAELVRTLKREGIVRKRARSDIWYVATAELDRLPPSPVAQWIAARRLDGLLPQHAACLRLCAVLGVELLRDELAWVQGEAARAGTASTAMTADAGLRALAREGLLVHLGDGAWTFPQTAFHDAVYGMIGEDDRVRLHGHALAFWRARAGEAPSARVLAAIARHAAACGANEEAADAHLILGERARGEHRDVDADQHYTTALGLVAGDDHARRVRALGGRGQVRYHLQRSPEALADLQAAQAHARALGDSRLLADLLLEEATALDWAEKFVESARRVEAAAVLVDQCGRCGQCGPCGDMRLQARLGNARGRCAFREERMPEAIGLLERAAVVAAAQEDDETHIVALLLLAPALVCVNRLEEAELRFEQVIALCERTGDRLHLCAAYCNRGYLWSAKKSLSGMAQDLRRAVKLAREIGQPMAERVATHNLAEFLHWSGKHRDALPLARRAHALQRFLPAPVAPDMLLLARIHAALDELDAVRGMLARVRALGGAAPPVRSGGIAVAMLELVLAEAEGRASAGAWERLIQEAEHAVPGEELLELHYFRARAAVAGARWQELARVLADARALVDAHPVWQASFDALARHVDVSS